MRVPSPTSPKLISHGMAAHSVRSGLAWGFLKPTKKSNLSLNFTKLGGSFLLSQKVPATSESPKHWHQPIISEPIPWPVDELTHLQPPVEPGLDMGSLKAQISPWFEASKPGRIRAVSRKGTCYFLAGGVFTLSTVLALVLSFNVY